MLLQSAQGSSLFQGLRSLLRFRDHLAAWERPHGVWTAGHACQSWPVLLWWSRMVSCDLYPHHLSLSFCWCCCGYYGHEWLVVAAFGNGLMIWRFSGEVLEAWSTTTTTKKRSQHRCFPRRNTRSPERGPTSEWRPKNGQTPVALARLRHSWFQITACVPGCALKRAMGLGGCDVVAGFHLLT